MAGRLFNEREVREILRRASSSQSGSPGSDGDGVSLAELKQIGSELGFDPTKIEEAANQLEAQPRGSTGSVSGRIFLDRTVEGEVSAEDWLGMVGVIQRYYKGAGAITQRGRNYDWAASEESGSLAVSVSSIKGRTRIRLESSHWTEIVLASVLCPTAALVVSLSMAKHGMALGVIPVLLFFGALLLGILMAARQRRIHSTMALMDQLTKEIGAESQSKLVPTESIASLTDHAERITS